MHTCLLFVFFWDQVKECKVKKVKEMDPYAFVNSENELLAERSFMTEKVKLSAANGYHQRWTEKMAKSLSPSQDTHYEVHTCGCGYWGNYSSVGIIYRLHHFCSSRQCYYAAFIM